MERANLCCNQGLSVSRGGTLKRKLHCLIPHQNMCAKLIVTFVQHHSQTFQVALGQPARLRRSSILLLAPPSFHRTNMVYPASWTDCPTTAIIETNIFLSYAVSEA